MFESILAEKVFGGNVGAVEKKSGRHFRQQGIFPL